ncbi:unnamed protein product [Calicophoron daubneyi]|uniref:Uncharacterized protein n=1 Tax=Calicophoron daubneyi TaxID=300641 RepID=A0AAV2T3B2_CALDB
MWLIFFYLISSRRSKEDGENLREESPQSDFQSLEVSVHQKSLAQEIREAEPPLGWNTNNVDEEIQTNFKRAAQGKKMDEEGYLWIMRDALSSLKWLLSFVGGTPPGQQCPESPEQHRSHIKPKITTRKRSFSEERISQLGQLESLRESDEESVCLLGQIVECCTNILYSVNEMPEDLWLRNPPPTTKLKRRIRKRFRMFIKPRTNIVWARSDPSLYEACSNDFSPLDSLPSVVPYGNRLQNKFPTKSREPWKEMNTNQVSPFKELIENLYSDCQLLRCEGRSLPTAVNSVEEMAVSQEISELERLSTDLELFLQHSDLPPSEQFRNNQSAQSDSRKFERISFPMLVAHLSDLLARMADLVHLISSQRNKFRIGDQQKARLLEVLRALDANILAGVSKLKDISEYGKIVFNEISEMVKKLIRCCSTKFSIQKGMKRATPEPKTSANRF